MLHSSSSPIDIHQLAKYEMDVYQSHSLSPKRCFPDFSDETLTASLNKLNLSTENVSVDAESVAEDETDSNKTKPKRVTFADSVGLELVQIRHMTAGRDTPPNLDPSIIASLLGNSDRREKPAGPQLNLEFQQPLSDYSNFRACINKNNVSLESVAINDYRLVGTVQVRNLAFHKTVFLRLTMDNWCSHVDIPAYYVNNGMSRGNSSFSTQIDTFSFEYDIPCDRLTSFPIMFAVCFQCESSEFWDNNGGKNYVISVKKSQSKAKPQHLLRRDSIDYFYETKNWTEFAAWKQIEVDCSLPYW